ncbi:MAG: hypothetical protein ACE5EO_02650 [Candidatus Krumholzibacteriia bacterium]
MYRRRLTASTAAVLLLAAGLVPACGDRTTPAGVNLLENSSFEEMLGGVPRGWELNNFRGLANMKAALYGVDDSLAFDGEQAFYFSADGETRRFFLLSQEIEMRGARRARVRYRKRTVDLDVYQGQYPQAGIALTYYDANHARFNSTRFADTRVPLEIGTTDGWVTQEKVFRLPPKIAYVVVHCVLGMSGRIWFDDLSVEVPVGLPWRQREGEVFTHYWLDEKPYPEGAIEMQRQLHDYYAARLGIPREAWKGISYYLYPDTATIREALGIKENLDIDYAAREIHSIAPVDDHEIVHMLTDVYGRLPQVLGEGTAYYLQGSMDGKPIQPQAQELLLAKKIPALEVLLNPSNLGRIDPVTAIVAGASFVGYLIEYGGTEKFLELHRQLDVLGSNTLQDVFENVYGGSFEEAERVWRLKLAAADFSKFKQPQEDDQ